MSTRSFGTWIFAGGTMRSAISLRLEGIAGSSIEDVAADALRVSKQLNIMVDFKFNGIYVPVAPHNTSQEIVEYFHRGLAFERAERKVLNA